MGRGKRGRAEGGIGVEGKAMRKGGEVRKERGNLLSHC